MELGTRVKVYNKNNFIDNGTIIDRDILDDGGDMLFDVYLVKLDNGSAVWNINYDIIQL